MFTNWDDKVEPNSVANHVKARQSLIERSELAKILLIYILRTYLCILGLYVRVKLMFEV